MCNLLSASAVGVFGALGLGLLAGGCVGAMSAEMASLLKEAAESQTALTMKIPKLYPFISSSYVTYISLLGAMLASAVGIESGRQTYHEVRKRSWGDSAGSALGLAAPAAACGVAASGAAVGAVLEIYFSGFVLPSLMEDSGIAVVFWHTLFFTVVSFLLFALLGFYCGGITVAVSFLTTYLTYSEHAMNMFYSTGSSLLLDSGSLLPLITPSLLLCLFRSLQLSRTAMKTPAVMMTTVLITRNLLRDEYQLVPLLDQAEVTLPALLVLERFFIIVLGIQMFQASCGAVLYSYFVTDEADKVYMGALAATAGIIMTLPMVSPLLGTGGSLGALLAASGGAGVALRAAGDVGQGYGGHVRAAGAAVGAAFGAFLLLATQDVEFGIMVALCAAAIPGSPYLMSGWRIISVFWQMLIPVLRHTLLTYFITVICLVALVFIFAVLYMEFFSSILIFFIFVSLTVFSDGYL